MNRVLFMMGLLMLACPLARAQANASCPPNNACSEAGAQTFNAIRSYSFSNVAVGEFSNKQMNEYAQSNLNGCLPGTIYTFDNGSNHSTDALEGCIIVPPTSTVNNANSVAGYVISQSTATYPVAGYFSAQAGADSVHIWGINPLCSDSSSLGSFTGVNCQNEFDQDVSSRTTTGNGLALTGSASVSNHNLTAIQIQRGIGAFPVFWVGLQCNNGATGSGACINIGTRGTGGNQFSQVLQFVSKDSGGLSHVTQQYNDPEGNHIISLQGGQLKVENGGVKLQTLEFSRLRTCDTLLEGAIEAVTDSTTERWGESISGGGSNHVLAYCDGTNWTVAAK